MNGNLTVRNDPQTLASHGEAFRDALGTIGISQEMAAVLLGVEGRTVRRWATDQARVPEVARALLWAMQKRDPLLVVALRDDYQPSVRELPETVDRFLWALARDEKLGAVLLNKWVPEDLGTTPLLEGLLMAVADVPVRAALLRSAERVVLPKKPVAPAGSVTSALTARQKERRDQLVERTAARRAARMEREVEASVSDPSPINGLSSATYEQAAGYMRDWITDDELPDSDPAWNDIHAALQLTYQPGISLSRWTKKAAEELVAQGYEEVPDGEQEQ